MIQPRIYVIGAFISAILLGACSSPESTKNTNVRTKGVSGQTINLNVADSASVDVVIEAAYEIAMGPGFMYAREFVDKALA
ncbi:MAG: hypothetical protein K2X47_07235, partial [Bdellovibrionales bacterium]|nr:hypothetical protein [Bdellovibrionales bacterium]